MREEAPKTFNQITKILLTNSQKYDEGYLWPFSFHSKVFFVNYALPLLLYHIEIITEQT